MDGARSRACASCGSPLAGDQRYCIACGERTGARDPQLVELLRSVCERPQAAGAGPPEPAPIEPPAASAASATAPSGGLTLPSPRISALLVLVFLGFGVLLGNVASSPVNDTLAASRRPLKIVLAAPTTSASAPATSSPSAPASPSSGEAPAAEETPTPAPARGAPAAARAPSHPSAGAPGAKGGSGGKAESGGEGAAGKRPPAADTTLPPIKHVFVIMLSDQPYAAVFGPASTAPYLSHTLEREGELLVHYDAVAHEELANELALLSGQGPTAETAANCPTYDAIVPASAGPDEQVLGDGCVYPASTQTLAGQLSAKRLSWRAYVQSMDEGAGQPGACAHPALGQADPSSGLEPAAGAYATFVNPFVYFRSLSESPACSQDDVGLGSLQGDLANPARTPSFSYIAPDRCHDGNPTPCTPGAPAGLAPADGFLQTVVPEIMASKAYKESGLLVITVDEAPSSGEFADSSSCCGQPRFPNLAAAPSGLPPRGGGTVGALLLSPFVKGPSTSQEPFNHFSLLRTIEDLFGLGHLGYAALPAVKSFEASMFAGH